MQPTYNHKELTVLVPGIRPENWERLYESVFKSFSGTWEMIFISPYDMPESIAHKFNTFVIKDWGTPIRAQQMGLLEAQGDYITWAADDGFFTEGSLDIAFEKLQGKKNTLVMGKYIEGENDGNYSMQSLEYYTLSNHDGSKGKHIPKDYLMLNVGVVPRQMLLDIGGWDCQFEVCPMAYNDLAVRLQNKGVKFIVQDEIMFKCSHMPGHTGDHAPIHDAQVDFDQPRFKKIYEHHDAPDRKNIDLNNWKETPERWERRFGKVEV